MRRSRLHALGQQRRRPGAFRIPRPRGHQSGERLPCARHPAGGGHHDAAGGDRPLLGARHHADDPDRDGERRRSRAMPACCCPSTPASPSGPAIILVAGALYVVSLLFGRVGGLVRQAFPRPPSRSLMRCRPGRLFTDALSQWRNAMLTRRRTIVAMACAALLPAAPARERRTSFTSSPASRSWATS